MEGIRWSIPVAIVGLVMFYIVSLTHSQTQPCDYSEDCITDITQKDCDKLGRYLIANSSVCGLCPTCQRKAELGILCASNDSCAPGLICIGTVCAIDPTNCLSSMHQNKISPVKNMPSCNLDGTWKPVQCKGDRLVGRCFCYSAQGKRIFGLSWATDAGNMTCACSRRRHELEMDGRIDVSLHCAPNGNYEPLQCDDGLCWCVSPKTGETTSTVVIEDLISQLPCYDATKFGSQYLRICESKVYAVSKLTNKLIIHGTTEVAVSQPKCDYDGTYGIYQIENGNAYCAWKDGSRLGSWAVVAGPELTFVNCNCARDTKYFALVNQTMTLTCMGNGNYRREQELNGKLYCVDDDGYPTTDLLDSDNLNCDE